MNDTGALRLTRHGRKFRPARQRGSDQGATFVVVAGMDDHAGGLLDHSQVLILVKDSQRDAFGSDAFR